MKQFEVFNQILLRVQKIETFHKVKVCTPSSDPFLLPYSSLYKNGVNKQWCLYFPQGCHLDAFNQKKLHLNFQN